jgi:hypothetical protein
MENFSLFASRSPPSPSNGSQLAARDYRLFHHNRRIELNRSLIFRHIYFNEINFCNFTGLIYMILA